MVGCALRERQVADCGLGMVLPRGTLSGYGVTSKQATPRRWAGGPAGTRTGRSQGLSRRGWSRRELPVEARLPLHKERRGKGRLRGGGRGPFKRGSRGAPAARLAAAPSPARCGDKSAPRPPPPPSARSRAGRRREALPRGSAPEPASPSPRPSHSRQRRGARWRLRAWRTP